METYRPTPHDIFYTVKTLNMANTTKKAPASWSLRLKKMDPSIANTDVAKVDS